MKLLLGLIILLSGCVTVQDHNPLANQILKPRAGFSGLTNRVCKKERFGECLEEHIQVYDLNDESFRELANKLNFICDIAGRRFKICLDQPGFCRIREEKKCKLFFCHKTNVIDEYIPGVDITFILKLDIRCYRQGLIPNR